MENPLILCIDIGTSECRAQVFDPNGRVLGSASKPCEIQRPKPGWAELDVTNVWAATVEMIKEVGCQVNLERVAGIGVSAQLGLVILDKNGEPLGPAMTWMDRRAIDEANDIRRLGDSQVYPISGRRCDPEHVACKALWLQRNAPDLYKLAACFISLKDYLVYCITGKIATDVVHASYSLLFDVHSRQWSDDLFKITGLDRGKFPDVFLSTQIIGNVSRQTAVLTGLVAGIPVVVGGPDGTVGALGAGLVDDKLAVNVAGTTNVFLACLDKPILDDELRLVVNCHALPDKWVIGGPTTTTGGCLHWFSREFGYPENVVARELGLSEFEILDLEAQRVQPGANALIFIPSLIGDRTPTWNPNARGVIFGLTPEHTRAHVVRAILEGAAYLTREIIEIIEEFGLDIPNIRLVGGGARSRLWAQIYADITGKRLEIPHNTSATCLGTVIVVGCAIGFYDNYRAASDRLVSIQAEFGPEIQTRTVYNEYYELFTELQRQLTSSFDLLGRIRNKPVRSAPKDGS